MLPSHCVRVCWEAVMGISVLIVICCLVWHLIIPMMAWRNLWKKKQKTNCIYWRNNCFLWNMSRPNDMGLLSMDSRDSLFVCNDINAGVVKGRGLGEEWSNDSHRSRDSLGITKWCPETYNGVWRPGHQEHYNHYNWHLPIQNKTKDNSMIKCTKTTLQKSTGVYRQY